MDTKENEAVSCSLKFTVLYNLIAIYLLIKHITLG